MIHLWKKLSFLFPSRYTVITSLFFSPTARHLLHTAFVCSTTPRNPPHHSRAAQWNASNHVPCSDPAAPRERGHHGHGGWDHHGNVSRWVHSQQGFVSVELSCEPRGAQPWYKMCCHRGSWQNDTNVTSEGLGQVVCVLSESSSVRVCSCSAVPW